MRKPQLFLLTLPVLLGSCNLEPALDRIDSPVSENFPGNGGGGVSADIAWNKFIVDPRLKRLVSIALENNRDLRVAALNVESTRAQYNISRSALFPSVNAVAAATRSRTPSAVGGGSTSATDTRLFEASVGVASYEVDIFGRIRSLNHAALQQFFASDAARVGVQISLVSEVANVYFAQRASLEQIALAQQTLDAVSETYGLTQKRFDAGDVSELDLRSVDIQVQTAKADLAEFKQRLAETNNALTLLLGTSIPSNLPEGRSLEGSLVAEVRAGVSSNLLTRRPDILGDLFQSGSSAWAFAPQLSVPIFDGGLNKANLDVAEIRKQMEIARYEKAIQTAFREVSDGLVARNGLNERINAFQGLVAAQEKRFELADARYKQGVDSYFEVLAAQQDLFNSRQSLIQLRLLRATNSIGLYKALGGGW
jgi:multidrug efflux system outer membrane protein